ncbi:MAG: phosphoribosylaminoimidazolesuccinocarboxamide synthase [Flavobacteriales bacterium Tduv]
MSVYKRDFLYEGKAKQIYATDDPELVIIHYKDDATAFNAQKKGTVQDKGILNNEISSLIFTYLEKQGIQTHFVEKINEREQLCRRVKILPLEVIVRNLIAGSMAKRLDIKEGTKPPNTIFELSYKNDDLGDPLINDHHAVVIGAATYEELFYLYELSDKINNLLKLHFFNEDIILVDFKIEFGKDIERKILLADEISPDTCRFWDKKTMKKLDKDRFRRDLGDVREAYVEILQRLNLK